MKKVFAPLFVLLLFVIPASRSQNALDQILPTSGGEVVFTSVRELKDQEIKIHMDKVKDWFSLQDFSFEQLPENDRTRDRAQGRGSIEVLWGPNNFEQYVKTLKFKIEIVVKKDRYQYRFDHFVVQDGSSEAQLEIYQSDTKLGSRYNADFYREIDQKMNSLIESLYASLHRK